MCPHLLLPLSSGLGRLVLALVGRFAPRLAPGFGWLFGSFAVLVWLAGRPSFCSFFKISLVWVWLALSAQDSTKNPRSVLFIIYTRISSSPWLGCGYFLGSLVWLVALLGFGFLVNIIAADPYGAYWSNLVSMGLCL